MDYRNRRYFLVGVHTSFTNNLDILVKEIIPSAKIHKLKSKNIPSDAIKVMISVKKNDASILFNVIRAILKLHESKYCYISKFVYIKEIKDEDHPEKYYCRRIHGRIRYEDGILTENSIELKEVERNGL